MSLTKLAIRLAGGRPFRSIIPGACTTLHTMVHDVIMKTMSLAARFVRSSA